MSKQNSFRHHQFFISCIIMYKLYRHDEHVGSGMWFWIMSPQLIHSCIHSQLTSILHHSRSYELSRCAEGELFGT